MEREIVLEGTKVVYTLRESARAKVPNITLHRNGVVVLSIPKSSTHKAGETFLKEKSKWVLKHLKQFELDDGIYLPSHKGRELELLKEYAELYVKRRAAELNEHYKFLINKITIKNQKSQWGSCSEKRNLNFTYKLILLPDALATYVIAHELCHLKEFNHTRRFWDLVAETVPNCKALDKELSRYHLR